MLQRAQAAVVGKHGSSVIVMDQLRRYNQALPHRKVSPDALSSCFYSGQFDKMKSPFEWDIVTRGLVAMTIEGFVGFFITIMCQYNFFRKPQ